MINVRIFPKSPKDSRELADFLVKHGFNLGPLTREGYFRSTVNSDIGAIDTLEYLKELSAAPKIGTRFEFTFEEDYTGESSG